MLKWVFIKAEYLIRKGDMGSNWLVSGETAVLVIGVLLIDREGVFERAEDRVAIDCSI